MIKYCPGFSMTIVSKAKSDRINQRMIDFEDAYRANPEAEEELMKAYLTKYEKDTELIMVQCEVGNADRITGFIQQRPGTKF